jgi:hypothetical protein
MSSASIRDKVSPAKSGMENGLPEDDEYPVPRVSKMIIRNCSASAERTGGFHISIVDAKPLMRTSGLPEPKSLYAMEMSSIAAFFTGMDLISGSGMTITISGTR